MARSLADLFDLPMVQAGDYPGLALCDGVISVRFLREHHAVPLAASEETITLAVADPFDSYLHEAVVLAGGRPVRCRVGVASEIDATLERLYGGGKSQMGQLVELTESDAASDDEDVEQLKDMASEAPVIRLVNLLLQRAAELDASDVHIEPFDGRLKIRYRIDGVLQEAEGPPPTLTAAFISRVKIMAKLNIAERRLPQDGRVEGTHPGQGSRRARIHSPDDARRERRHAPAQPWRRRAGPADARLLDECRAALSRTCSGFRTA
jgi:general secretion pathway protein E